MRIRDILRSTYPWWRSIREQPPAEQQRITWESMEQAFQRSAQQQPERVYWTPLTNAGEGYSWMDWGKIPAEEPKKVWPPELQVPEGL